MKREDLIIPGFTFVVLYAILFFALYYTWITGIIDSTYPYNYVVFTIGIVGLIFLTIGFKEETKWMKKQETHHQKKD